MVIKQMEAQDLYPLELVTNVPMNFRLNTKCPSMSVFLFNIFSFYFSLLFLIIIFYSKIISLTYKLTLFGTFS